MARHSHIALNCGGAGTPARQRLLFPGTADGMLQLPLLHHFRAAHGILARLSTRDREAAREAEMPDGLDLYHGGQVLSVLWSDVSPRGRSRSPPVPSKVPAPRATLVGFRRCRRGAFRRAKATMIFCSAQHHPEDDQHDDDQVERDLFPAQSGHLQANGLPSHDTFSRCSAGSIRSNSGRRFSGS